MNKLKSALLSLDKDIFWIFTIYIQYQSNGKHLELENYPNQTLLYSFSTKSHILESF
jgi:hypothetical protein